MMATERFSLKDHLFHAEKVYDLSASILAVHPTFPKDSFDTAVLEAFPELELKQRIAHIASCWKDAFTTSSSEEDEVLSAWSYPASLDVLLRSLPPPLDPTKTDDDFGDFIYAPYSHYVAMYGCTEEEHLELSLDALREITQRFSAEFAIRDFLNAYPTETMAFLEDCATHDNYHVRRLASEGSRPKLPWGVKLTAIDYRDPVSRILARLTNDPTRYVTRSVANHLNDVSKIDPELVLETLQSWKESDASNTAETEYICQHALRTLVKQKHTGALRLLGFSSPRIRGVRFMSDTPSVVLGQAVEFRLQFKSLSDQSLVIDYTMEFATKAAGERRTTTKRPSKVFKWKKLDVTKGQAVTMQKRHPMRIMTTRKLVPGTHSVTLQINGESMASFRFQLVDSPAAEED